MNVGIGLEGISLHSLHSISALLALVVAVDKAVLANVAEQVGGLGEVVHLGPLLI